MQLVVAAGQAVSRLRVLEVRVSHQPELLEPARSAGRRAEQLPPFYDHEGGEIVAEGSLHEEGDLLVLELPDDLSLTMPRSEEANRAAASRVELLL